MVILSYLRYLFKKNVLNTDKDSYSLTEVKKMEFNNPVPKEILECISPRIRKSLENLQNTEVFEIRLRIKSPVVIVTKLGSAFITKNGRLTQILSDQCLISAEYEITDTLNKCCGYSLHSYSKEIVNGFITLSCGARVGVCGTAVYENEILKSVKNVSCLNIRIPRMIRGASDNLIKSAFSNELNNLMIIGPPSSGKTTILKDLAYQISDGRLGKYYKVCVIDERFEISGEDASLGPNTDIIKGFPKAKAISMAIRTMSPEVIICDEVSLDGETEEIVYGINCGVKFIITAHANEEDFFRRNDLITLCKKGRFMKIAFLSGANSPGKIQRIVGIDELIENSRNNIDDSVGNFGEYKLYKAN